MVSAFDPNSQTPASSLNPPPALSSEALAVLRGGGNVRRCLDELLGRGLPADALAIVARTLPKRYVVAWACDCLKGVLPGDPATSDVDRAGLALAQQWLADPTEENRRAAPAEAAVAALRLTASRAADYVGMSTGFVTRALQIFGPAVTAPRTSGATA